MRFAGVERIGPRDGAHFDEGDVAQRQGIIVSGKKQLAVVFGKTPYFPLQLCKASGRLSGAKRAVARAPVVIAEFKAPDGAVWRDFIEQVQIAQIDEVGDCAGFIKQAVKRDGRGGFEQVAWRDEDQLATRCQMVQAFFDEKEVKIGAAVEYAVACQVARGLRDVLVTDVWRIADDRGEAFFFREFKKIHDPCPRWREIGIDLDADGAGDMREKSAIAAGRFQYAPVIAYQFQHTVDDGRRREKLAESKTFGIVGQAFDESAGHGGGFSFTDARRLTGVRMPGLGGMEKRGEWWKWRE